MGFFMNAIIQSNYGLNGFYNGVYDSAIAVKDATVRVVDGIYKDVITPIGVGATAGVCNLAGGIILANIIDVVGLSTIWVDEVAGAAYEEFVSSSFIETAIKAPLLEEIFFRFVVQGSIQWLMDKIFPEMTVSIFSYEIRLATLVSVVATAALFGYVHLANGLGIIQVILCATSGLVFGALKSQYGMGACTTAHMVNNAIAFIL